MLAAEHYQENRESQGRKDGELPLRQALSQSTMAESKCNSNNPQPIKTFQSRGLEPVEIVKSSMLALHAYGPVLKPRNPHRERQARWLCTVKRKSGLVTCSSIPSTKGQRPVVDAEGPLTSQACLVDNLQAHEGPCHKK